jgi:hypothetical protein
LDNRLNIKSKVPLTSVKRYFNGETKSPGFLPLSAIIVALGGSVDEVLGLIPQAQKPTNNEFTRQLQSDLWYERKQKRQWVLIFILLVAFDLGLLLFDILNPDMGYIRYVEQASLITQDAFVMMFSMFLK